MIPKQSLQQIQMQNQQSQVSSSTRYRFSQHNRTQQLGQYINFKTQNEKVLSGNKIQELKKIYPHGILGRNQNNFVVVMDRIGSIKVNELNKIVDDDTFAAYICQRLIYLSEKVLNQKEQVIWVIDLSGKVMQLASKKSYTILQKIVANAHKYFPGLLHKLYFINTPMLFDTIWNKISESIDAHTLTKFIHLTDDLEQLVNEVGLPILPQSLGGDQPNQILNKVDTIETSNKQNKKDLDLQQAGQQQQIDFNSLKMALSGLKLGGNPNKHPSVAQTPLNTEADDPK